ncbi:hypothetical protein T03_10162 [Trichinella britovi]|uniref:Uncharacterized protein n=1 Tax=Trichinella britovi TaxID=45882 RepID=A0A0V1CAK2_TRIBR|nr:hypothetical protein T03_10162 [Trichinella britovi]
MTNAISINKILYVKNAEICRIEQATGKEREFETEAKKKPEGKQISNFNSIYIFVCILIRPRKR